MTLFRRPMDLFFIIYLIPAMSFCVFRGLVRNTNIIEGLKHISISLIVGALGCPGLFQRIVSALRATLRAIRERPVCLP